MDKECNGNMEITHEDMEKIVADLKALAEPASCRTLRKCGRQSG